MELKECKFVTESIQDNVLKEGDELWIDPIHGKKQRLKLRYQQLCLESDNNPADKPRHIISLPHMQSSSFKVRIYLEQFRSNLKEIRERYVFEVLEGGVIKLNGQYVFSGILQVGDKLEIGHNELSFHRENFFKSTPLKQISHKVALSELPILIEGETGVGKTSLARKIHLMSKRPGAFIHLNISSLSSNLIESELFGHIKGAFTGADYVKKGAFREADKGTIFIDEIDSLPLDIQTKLLLFLDDMHVTPVGSQRSTKVNARVIFSSGQKLTHLVEKSKMRKDFYYRISSGVQMKLPTLRDEPERVKEFCEHFALKHDLYFTPKLIEFYQTLPWPGNYRQLKGHLERKRILTDSFKLDLDETDNALIAHGGDLIKLSQATQYISLKELKQSYIHKVYLSSQCNPRVTAEKLGISVRSVRNNLLGYKMGNGNARMQ